MPEEFNEMLILLGKLVGLKSQTKTIQRRGVSSKLAAQDYIQHTFHIEDAGKHTTNSLSLSPGIGWKFSVRTQMHM